MKFKLGEIHFSLGVLGEMGNDNDFAEFVFDSLKRHENCDWGDLDSFDKRLNDDAVEFNNDRILSKYISKKDNNTIYIITEWDRSATTVLFPEEY
jgi:hypothetical protein